jgi:hypothetical protein
LNPENNNSYNVAMRYLTGMINASLDTINSSESNRFAKYRFDPIGYIDDVMNGKPWHGIEGHDGQAEIIQDYGIALKKQWERKQWEIDKEFPLTCYEPDEKIQNWLRVESGHGLGKTRLSAWIVSHFFDCFSPSITYCYAPTFPQINDLLFKEIRVDRIGRDDLPGKVLKSPVITTDAGNHFVKGRATTGAKTEAIQGQHVDFHLFILDEAEGLPSTLWQAIKAMTTGGIAIVIMLANPRTRTSEFYKCASLPYVRSYRLSCLWFPNVYYDKELVPNGTGREYVDDMIDTHCQVVPEHNPDMLTFEVHWRRGRIYLPSGEFLFRVMGVAPLATSIDTFSPVARFEDATHRDTEGAGKQAYIGIDAARYGGDKGTIYCRHGDRVWLHDEIERQDGYEYYISVLKLINALREKGVTEIYIRVDGGGGYGSTVIDNLSHNDDLYSALDEFIVSEVHFNGVPYENELFSDRATELYYHAGEALRVVGIIDYAPSLQDDLCYRRFRNVIKSGRDVKRLRSKEEFRAEYKRSPDHGDGFVLAVAPQYLFSSLSELGFG